MSFAGLDKVVRFFNSFVKIFLLKQFILLVILTGLLVPAQGLAQSQDSKEPQASDNPQSPVVIPKPLLTGKKKKKYVLFPVIVKSPEYLWGAGGAGTYYFKMGKDTTVRSSNVKAVGFYTLRKQLVFGSESTFYFPSERYIGHLLLSFSHFPDRFWGLGDETPSSNQESYSIEQFTIQPQISRMMLKDFYVGVGYDMQTVFDFEYNRDGTSLFDKENITGRNGGTISGPSFLLTFDNRSNAFAPDRGFYVQYIFMPYDKIYGSSFNFLAHSLDVRKFFPLKKSRVLAMQMNVLYNTGDVPIRSLANMGNSSFMRGYYDGRYADKNLIAFQTELRTPVYGRFGLTVFSGVGRVASHFSTLFTFTELKPSFGFGLRYALSPKEKLNLRVDAGWGKKSQGTYINLGEAF